jgi:hypothetical protein
LFAILAIGPEAEIDKAGYAKSVRLAKQRLKRLEKPRRRSSLGGNYKLVIEDF